MPDLRAVLAELDDARAAFHDALGAVDAELVTVPGVLEDWSVRDIVVHVAAWCEHAAGALDLAASGRGEAFAYSTADTDAMNARILADGRSTSPEAALAREDAGFRAFRERLASLDPELLDLRLGNGDSVLEVVRYDGADHYAEHSGHLQAWFAAAADDDA